MGSAEKSSGALASATFFCVSIAFIFSVACDVGRSYEASRDDRDKVSSKSTEPQTQKDPRFEGIPVDRSEEGPEGRRCDGEDDSDEILCGDWGISFCGATSFDSATKQRHEIYGACVLLDDLECMPGDIQEMDLRFCENEEVECALDWEANPVWAIPQACEQDEEDNGEEGTPLVLRLNNQPIHFSNVGSEAFDISVTSNSCLSFDWPSHETPWLAMDRNGNGKIDDGRELFGSGTRLQSGRRATDGFMALADLDENKDGKIDANDSAFDQLLLWGDIDQDRKSTPSELSSLSDHGIQELETNYHVDRICDLRGNCEIERGRFHTGKGVGEIVDIHLGCQ